MKVWLIALMAGVAVLPQPAAAAARDFVPGLQSQRAQPSRGPGHQGQREMRREHHAAPERGERPRHRLTEDERRDLRRDIDQADREIYRRDRRR